MTWAIIDTGSVFGTSIQYERQISENISVAGGLGYREICVLSSDGNRAKLASFSLQGHGRIYPDRNKVFIDGMFGYANFIYLDENIHSLSHYFQIGTKLGWRIDFGKPGGLVLEPSFGYYIAIGKTNKLFNEDNQLLNQLYENIIRGFFVGGLQISLGLGYRF